jgi:hypothetical protein
MEIQVIPLVSKSLHSPREFPDALGGLQHRTTKATGITRWTIRASRPIVGIAWAYGIEPLGRCERSFK